MYMIVTDVLSCVRAYQAKHKGVRRVDMLCISHPGEAVDIDRLDVVEDSRMLPHHILIVRKELYV